MPLPQSFVELTEAQQEGKRSNVIGTVIDALPGTTTKKGDHMLTFTLYDGTLQHGQKCRLFARKAQDLPQINGLGDIVLLKGAIYRTVNGAGLLSSSHGSPCPWAVFHSPIPKSVGAFGVPPRSARFQVPDISKEIAEYVVSLGSTQDCSKFTPLNEEVKAKVANMKQRQTCQIKDLIIDSFPQIVGEVVKVFFNYERASLYITDYTENQLLYNYGTKSKTAEDGVQSSKWPGPPGKYTLLVECWPPHSIWIRENVSPGAFLQLENVHIKNNREHGCTEGALHTSKHSEDQLRVRKLETKDVAELLVRKEMLGWADGFDKRDSESDEEDGKTGKTKISSKQRKRKRKQAEQEQAEQHSKRAKSEIVGEITPQQDKSSSVPPHPAIAVNENVQCEERPYPHRSIAEIRDMSPSMEFTSTNDLEELNRLTSYATVRVIDFKPGKLEDFAKARDMTEEEQQEAEVANSSDSETKELDTASQRSANSLYNDSTQIRRQVWEWKFYLLLEDASASVSATGSEGKADGSSNNQLIACISNADAEYLLNTKAIDLRHNPQTLNRLRETLFILWGDLEERNEQRAARVLGEISSNASSSNSSQNVKVKSLPFKCILEEYGEESPGKLKRKFRIKGTTIKPGSSSEKQQVERPVELDDWAHVDENDTNGEAQKVQSNEDRACNPVSVRAPRAG